MDVTKKQNGSELLLELSGSIDSVTSPKFNEVIEQSIKEINSLILDFKKIDYISSAGLRMILRLRKADPEASIVNVIPEVYEIFDMTGFTDMMPVSKI